MIENLIKKHNLTEQEVLSIVWEWYNSYPKILQDEDGEDLGGVCETEYWKIEDSKTFTKNLSDTKKVLDQIFNIYGDTFVNKNNN